MIFRTVGRNPLGNSRPKSPSNRKHLLFHRFFRFASAGCQRLYTVFKLKLLPVYSPGGTAAGDKSQESYKISTFRAKISPIPIWFPGCD